MASLSVGIIFWAYISHFGLGLDSSLTVTRAASRAFIINIRSFEPLALLLGSLFGLFLSYTPINGVLLFGGLLMPIDLSIMLVFGGFTAYLVKNKEEYYPFSSGVFAGNSLWMLLQVFL